MSCSFRLAAGVVLVHVVLDAFILLEPGADVSKHVRAAVAASALLGVTMVAYGGLPFGLRAAASLLFGVTALVRGGVAVVDAMNGGPLSVSSWSAFLLIPTGATLLLVAAFLLWRSQKAGRWRWPRRAALGVGALVLAYWVVVPISVAIVATEKPRAAVEEADLGRPHMRVSLVTEDGLRLAGWYVPSRNGAAVIVFPGRSGPLAHARVLVRHGYGVLLVDMRGQGESEGDANAFGWGSSRDLDAALAYLSERRDVENGRIGGLGLSVGGEVMIETAAARPALAAVVSEGAGERSVRETLLLGARGWFALPAAAVQTAAVWLFSGERVPPALDSSAARVTPRPLLLVYGQRGQDAERDLNPRYFMAAGQPAFLWEVPGADHTGGLKARPAEYERRIVAFFDRALDVTTVSTRGRDRP